MLSICRRRSGVVAKPAVNLAVLVGGCCKRRRAIASWTVHASKDALLDQQKQSASSPAANTVSTTSVVLFDSLTSSYRPVRVSAVPDSGRQHNDQRRSPLGIIWYTCGPTVYDAAHLGHARTYVALDLIRRAVLAAHASLPPNDDTPPPLFVMNVTDVDDKILKRARETGEDPIALARKFEKDFWQDMDSLNVLRPDVVTRVTEHVDCTIVPYIEKIIDNGMAYVMADGDDEEGASSSVYFDVGAFESANGGLNKYGKLAPSVAAAAASTEADFFSWDADNVNAGDGNNHNNDHNRRRRKRDARDFVLWKGRKDGEGLYWDSPWGPGRPGWHIECSAMIENVLETFALSHRMGVHAGGIDLKFPHHTNEIAQAEAYHVNNTGIEGKEEWIPHWVHTGHLHIQGMKMSKSLKNFVRIRQLLSPSSSDEAPATSLASPSDDFRLWCLGISGSYRGPATYSEARIQEARSIREKIIRFLVDGEEWIQKASSGDTLPTGKWKKTDVDLSKSTASCAASCKLALMGSTDAKGGFDLDGSLYLQAIVELVEAGSAFIASSNNDGNTPVEPLRAALSTLRKQLSIVGFTDKTVKARMTSLDNSSIAAGNVKGGERSIIDELVAFRSRVRVSALAGIKDNDGDGVEKTLKELLALCDEVRNKSLPSIGVEILDGNIQDASLSGADEAKRWRFCVPRTNEGVGDTRSSTRHKKRTPQAKGLVSDGALSLKDFLSLGKYEDTFSKFNDAGFPTHNADGNEVSKRLLKKVTKKYEKYLKNVEKKMK